MESSSPDNTPDQDASAPAIGTFHSVALENETGSVIVMSVLEKGVTDGVDERMAGSILSLSPCLAVCQALSRVMSCCFHRRVPAIERSGCHDIYRSDRNAVNSSLYLP
jgi:hypothetical protein